jgi:hypothetical protein
MNKELLEQASSPFVTTKDNHPGMGLTRIETLFDMYGLHWALDSACGRGTCVTLEVAESGRTDTLSREGG